MPKVKMTVYRKGTSDVLVMGIIVGNLMTGIFFSTLLIASNALSLFGRPEIILIAVVCGVLMGFAERVVQVRLLARWRVEDDMPLENEMKG